MTSMGFIRKPHLLLEVLESVIKVTNYRFVLFTSGYEPLDAATRWLFPKCAVAIHHGGSGSTSAALHAGTPQVVCPCMLDQFYWAERMFWLGVFPEPLKRNQLLTDEDDDISIIEAASALTKSIDYALSAQVKPNVSKISQRLSSEFAFEKKNNKVQGQRLVFNSMDIT
ncbi:hypothetical protein L2E82_43090 [Cichorium intybus]|uniref:Uncharacterized protein n=1 Tax=Cichorium intybus TaxID=13427 RepID=A0ACB8ZM82_CICIN|nr:hypothetical protein L2E82_43090 [Cichorium intybus]